ncbi:MAG: L-threonylcarbamoyladenylate synthase [Candidatus Omnitrophota bacterium]
MKRTSVSEGRIVDAREGANVKKAVEILQGGGLVAFPTETVYGLGADALNAKAVCRLFEAKKRPSFDPLIVHVSDPEHAYPLWKSVSKTAKLLIGKFWPGPLTLVLPRTDIIPDVVTAGLPTVAVRMPDAKAALEVIRLLGRPVAAPSANLFGYTSPTTAQAVSEDLGDAVDLILDDGPARIGIESTVLKLEGDECVLLRPGGVPIEEIEKVIPVKLKQVKEPNGVESPGQLQSHYAPWTPMTVMDKNFKEFAEELDHLYRTCQKSQVAWPRLGLLAFESKTDAPWFEVVEVLSPHGDLYQAAANLFQAVRKLDKMNLDLIVAERIPEKGIGLAVMDRLKKASGGKLGIKKFFAGVEL